MSGQHHNKDFEMSPLAQLYNDKFVNNAPADVDTQERQRAVDFEKTIAQLDEQLEKLAELT